MIQVLKIEDLVGTVYGRFTILEEGNRYIEPNGKAQRVMICECSCGTIKNIKLKELRRGDIKSCGCLAEEIKIKVKPNDIYGHWTVVEECESYRNDKNGIFRRVLAKCICGKEKQVLLGSLKKGESKSCGCKGIPPKEKTKKEKIIPIDTEEEQWKESVSYKGYYISTLGRLFNYSNQYMFPKSKGYSITVLGKTKDFQIINEMYKTFINNYDSETHYTILISTEIRLENIRLNIKPTDLERDYRKKIRNRYKAMISRCYDENNKDYKSYGYKGIEVCDEWKNDFNAYFKWCIENNIGAGIEIDRINNYKEYSPENCQPLTKTENLLKQLNLSIEDVLFIRSKLFDWGKHRKNYKCSNSIINNIIEGKSFKHVV